MVNVAIDSSEFDSLPDDIEKYAAAFGPEVDAAMGGLAEMLRAKLEEITKKRTGETAAAWTVVAAGVGEFIVTNSNEPVITYLTQGTAAHFVRPVSAKALHWVDESGVDRFSMGHEVRGIVGEDYEAEALDWLEPYIDQFLDAADDAAWRKAGL